jgi:hypothetical protein
VQFLLNLVLNFFLNGSHFLDLKNLKKNPKNLRNGLICATKVFIHSGLGLHQ